MGSHVVAQASTLHVSKGEAPSCPRPHSSGSLRRCREPVRSIATRPHSSQSLRQRRPEQGRCATNAAEAQDEEPLSGTLHRYFHSRTSTLGWSAHKGSETKMRPAITRPVTPPASVY